MSTTAAVKESEVEQIDHVLGEEYEHKPVPPQARRSLFSVTMVWIGFPMIITGAMTGSVLVLGMGFQRALIAMIIGNLIMFAYVGALGALGTKKGMNFALIASIVFGRKGYVFSLRAAVYAAARLVCGADRHYRQSHQLDLSSELRADDRHRRRCSISPSRSLG